MQRGSASNIRGLCAKLLLAFGAVWPLDAAEPPDALKRAREQRMRAETGLVEWSMTTARGVRGSPDSSVRFYTSRFAGDTTLQIATGDEQGVVVRREDGTVGGGGQSAQGSVHVDGRIWKRESNALQAEVWGDGGRLRPGPDVRAFGLHARDGAPSIHERTWSGYGEFEGAIFREWSDGEMRVVRADLSKDRAVQWWIDPSRGWSVTRVAEYDGEGNLRLESRSKVEEFDGVWLPVQVDYFDAEFHRGAVPVRTVHVHCADVNAPEHPARLGPTDIGLESGMSVMVMDEVTLRGKDHRIWDGTALISTSEWVERNRSGTARFGPTFLREAARRRAATWKSNPEARRSDDWTASDSIAWDRIVGASAAESDWQKYTREFIARYRLDEDQAQRARQICKDCETQRDHYRNRRKAEFAAVDDAERAARASGAAAEEWNKLRENRSRLEAPMQAIFEEQLKPRLEKLPTRAQREAAGPVESESRGPESKNNP